ncbi:MAG: hypothetical protein KGQ60_08670 [Planctomycetes bacterium]|nr:hypothetical protein [Planctomycetota bacterium]
MRNFYLPRILLVAFMTISIVGCGGSNEAIIPKDALTEEQKAAIKADDQRIADEESQGSNKSKSKKK